MKDETNSLFNRPLQILSQLAAEYQAKFADLEAFARDLPDEELIQQLGALGERTTDHFRGAQQAMFSMLPESGEPGGQPHLQALTVLCRCFDEMRILCQVLLERLNHSKK